MADHQIAVQKGGEYGRITGNDRCFAHLGGTEQSPKEQGTIVP